MAKRKLIPSQKKRIYELYQEDEFSQQKLADLFDISQSTIHSIIREMKHEDEINKYKLLIYTATKEGIKNVAKAKNNVNEEYYLNDSQYD